MIVCLHINIHTSLVHISLLLHFDILFVHVLKYIIYTRVKNQLKKSHIREELDFFSVDMSCLFSVSRLLTDDC